MDIGTKHVVDPRKGSGWKAKKRLAHDTGEDGRCQSLFPFEIFFFCSLRSTAWTQWEDCAHARTLVSHGGTGGLCSTTGRGPIGVCCCIWGVCILGSNLVEGPPDMAINPVEGVPVSI